MSHEFFMARALQLAERGLFTTDPNPRVGCVIVKAGTIIAEGWHQKAGEAHAEVHALSTLTSQQAHGSDCYITLEPCSHTGRTPPCVNSLIEAGIKRAFIAMTDPNPLVAGQGVKRLKEAGIEVTVGILEQQSEALNRGFCQRMRAGRPYIRSKIAMSIDGRTAMSSGESKWITGSAARRDVQKLRAQSSAILTGIGTILADDPELTVRIDPQDNFYPDDLDVRQALRVIVDSQLQISNKARVFNNSTPKLIVTASEKASDLDAEIVRIVDSDGEIDLNQMMKVLAEREVNNVLVEAGSKLNGSLLSAGLIDELILYMAPKIMGDSAKGLFHLPDLQIMSENIELTITDIRAVGSDWRITAKPIYL
jgi:diaminohydroxyphosphoribosylaminopyrimidine deaminase/5-amino-6-(5-phosphoribosylamino)uracil reductase